VVGLCLIIFIKMKLRQNKKILYQIKLLLCFTILASLISCAAHHKSKQAAQYSTTGIASWYGPGFAGEKTANGERYKPSGLTAAHKTLPFGTCVKVTNLANNESVIVRINDRGPYVRGRLIDLSQGAAKKISMLHHGTTKVKIETIIPSENKIAKTVTPAPKSKNKKNQLALQTKKLENTSKDLPEEF